MSYLVLENLQKQFGSPEVGIDWGVLSAGTLIAISPLLAMFLLFQRQFMQSFMNAGLK